MRTSVIKILELPNFGHMTACKYNFKISFLNPYQKLIFQNTLRKPGVVNFADIIKTPSTLIKKL